MPNAPDISSADSEGAFTDFIDRYIEEGIKNIVNNIDERGMDVRGDEVVFEIDGICPPTFVYDRSGQGGGPGGIGKDPGRLVFSLPFEKFMEIVGKELRLPNLIKEGDGKIMEMTERYKTFGPTGVILDKKRTFKRALKTNVALGNYDPENGKYDIWIRRRDKRFKLPVAEEKPKYSAVVFYIGDISYSTWGERLELEKKVVSFIEMWIDWNYGIKNVEHRFFVHDTDAHEVTQDQFYTVNNAGGTEAAPAFELCNTIAMNEYNPSTTNFYMFYFGDGEVFEFDARRINEIIKEDGLRIYSRIGVTEVKPSNHGAWGSCLVDNIRPLELDHPKIVRVSKLFEKRKIFMTVKRLFGSESEVPDEEEGDSDDGEIPF